MKKLLFLIILLIPFSIKAVSINDIHYKWKYEDQNDVMGLYNANNYFITHTDDKLVSMSKRTGEKKELTIETRSIHAMIDNNILLVTPSENYGPVNVVLYDEQLNEISNIQTEEMGVIDIKLYNDNNIVIVGNQQTNEGYNLVSILIAENGKVSKTEKQKETGFSHLYIERHESKEVYVDFNSNMYELDGYKLEPFYKNSDNSYMYLTNNKFYKLSSTGEEVDSLDIPNGKGTRMVKLDNYYYIASGNYTTTGTDTSIALDLYKVDEDLNIVATDTIEAPTVKTDKEVPEEGFDQEFHIIYLLKNRIICYISPKRGYYSNREYYEINSDLEAEKVSGGTEKPYNYVYKSSTLNSNYLLYFVDPLTNYEGVPEALNGHLPTDITEREYRKINETLGYLDGVRNRDVYRDGKNYVVIDTYEQCEGENCYSNSGDDYLLTTKTNMIYLDNKYNEVFRKDLVDWYTLMQGQTNKDIITKKARTLVKAYDEYIVVAVSSYSGNLLQMYDREGNLLKDFSEEISKYENLMVFDLFINERGIYVSLTSQEDDRLSPHYEGNSFNYNYNRLHYYIYDYDNNLPHSVIVHLSPDFIINRKVTGNGTVTSTLEKAEEGTVVRFTVTPDPGYVLSVVKVIDSKGNVLIFTNNTFTMPSSDVTIEAIFVPINPQTGDIAIFAITIIAIISAAVVIAQKRKLNFLK